MRTGLDPVVANERNAAVRQATRFRISFRIPNSNVDYLEPRIEIPFMYLALGQVDSNTLPHNR